MNYVPPGTELSKTRGNTSRFSEIVNQSGFGRSILCALAAYGGQTAFDALAAACDFGPLRFSRKLANMALARAGKSRWIRSMR